MVKHRSGSKIRTVRKWGRNDIAGTTAKCADASDRMRGSPVKGTLPIFAGPVKKRPKISRTRKLLSSGYIECIVI